MSASSSQDTTTCCIVGGGPAGIFLGYLLARSGVAVTVLEKHADFLRDFRGDTIHPSTLQLLHELNLLDEFLAITDFRAEQLWVNVQGRRIAGPTFAHLNTRCKFVGFVPQWDFLDLLSRHGARFAGFDLRMNTRATGLVREAGRVAGVRCENDAGECEIRADLVVAADGRDSTLRTDAARRVIDTGVPIDALWFRLDRPADSDAHTLAWLRDGRMLVTIPRREHYQVALVIKKNGFEMLKARGIEEFRKTIGSICPPLKTVARGLEAWDDVKLLSVQINHIDRWYEEGLLFIGDAAHAMSPMGGVGINLAIQDAVAAANRLAEPLRTRTLELTHLEAVQKRREPPARRTQMLQARMHATLFGDNAAPDRAFAPPWYAALLARLFAPLLRRLGGRLIGIGFRPEHIETD